MTRLCKKFLSRTILALQPRDILEVTENTREKEITRGIVATDPDTTANLKFTINWEDSYASKPGFVVDPKFYEG